MEIRILCESGHERIQCEPLHVSKAWWCPTCGEVVGDEIVKMKVPPEYWPSASARMRVLLEIADYDIELIIRDQAHRVVDIEYPRR